MDLSRLQWWDTTTAYIHSCVLGNYCPEWGRKHEGGTTVLHMLTQEPNIIEP